MKVFICWSGGLSEKIASEIRGWLPSVLQSVEPYFTPSDVEKGARWLPEITRELSESKVGILCVTRENVHSDWLLFEAGALSKQLEKAHVCPILFGMKPTDLAGPLRQFQATEFEKGEFSKLVSVINGCLSDHKLPAKTLEKVFEKWWPDIEDSVNQLMNSAEDSRSDEPVRSDRDILEELLQLTRIQYRTVQRTRRHLVSPSVMSALLDGYITLHNQQANKDGGYEETLDSLKRMHEPISLILKNTDRSSELLELFEQFDNLSHEVVSDDDSTDSIDDDLPF